MSDKKKTELVTLYKNQLVTDSRKVAEHFGKRHDHVIRDIEELISQNPKLGSDYFYETSYTAGTGKHYKMYLMNHDGFSLLVMGFTGKTALEWKLKFLEAFNTMEKEIRKQQAVPKIAPNPQLANSLLKDAGLQESVSGHWVLTEKGAKFGESIPFTASSGHSGYQIKWSPKVLEILKKK